MSYIALARKWRPQTFSELLGQEHLVTALENSLNNNRLHHAYLFTGTRGVGKTSVARILAKSLNCEQGISAHPCLKCASCIALAEGRFIDLIEIDGASKTKVEDTRELLENVQYAPTVGKFKIYLIDEVHMLSQHSFNALLKTLEEPPSHVKFILATTDPEKLPVTVLSRCLQFTLRNVPQEIIFLQLEKILISENIEFEEQALKIIAMAANGSMRDALSLLDQAIVGCNKIINSVDVKSILGYTQQNYASQIIQALITKEPHKLFAISQKINEDGGLFTYVVDQILSILHKISIHQIIKEIFTADLEAYELSKLITAEDLQLLYQIALKGRDDMLLAPTPLIGFEMLLLRMYTFTPLTRQNFDNRLLAKPAADSISEKNYIIEKQDVLADESATIESLRQNESKVDNSNLSNKNQASIVANITDTETPTVNVNLQKFEDWQLLIPKLNLRGLSLTAAENSIVDKFEDGTYYLRTDTAHESLFNKSVINSLETALSKFYNSKIKINLNVGKKVGSTPAEIKQEIADKNLKEASQSLEQDAFFQRLQDEFSAELIKNSIVSLKDKI